MSDDRNLVPSVEQQQWDIGGMSVYVYGTVGTSKPTLYKLIHAIGPIGG